jgi:hypothetical protein
VRKVRILWHSPHRERRSTIADVRTVRKVHEDTRGS